MKKIYNLLFVFVMLVISSQAAMAQTAFGIGIGSDEPLDSIAVYEFVPAGFGSHLPYNVDSLLTGEVVLVKDKSGNTTACDSIPDDLTGLIAVVDRGACGFDIKCYNAWKKGAKAIIVVNNVATAPIIMGASNPAQAALINVPCMMVSLADGNVIKQKVADNDSYFVGVFQPNQDVYNPYPITPGEWIVPVMESGEGALGDTLATNAAWYTYKPATSGKMSISSCGFGANTSLFVYELVGNQLFPYAANLSACAKDALDTNKEAAELKDLAAKANTTYYIEWNDLASPDSFNFVLTFSKADSVDVTFKVDMKNESVDSKGVHLAGDFQGWNPSTTLCTNIAGTTVWTKTMRVKSDATHEYKFINGDAWGKDESVTGICAVTGGGNRKIAVGTDNIELNVACYKSCDACVNPPLVCDPNAIICDDFDKYTPGGLNAQSANWDVWDGDTVNAGDGVVSTENATSGKNALKIDGTINPAQDVIFVSGDRTAGNYTLKFKMFVPSGKRAYYSVQHDITKAKHIWANDVIFYSSGGGFVSVGTKLIGNITYKHDQWFDVVQNINIDKDTSSITINGKTLGWKWNQASNGSANVSNSKLGGMDFYADSTFTKYYIDDVQLINIPPPTYDVTFSVDMKNETVDPAKGVCIAGSFQKAAGYAEDWKPGITKLANKTGTTVWELKTKIPAGKYEFKFINDDSWTGKEEKMTGKPCYSSDNRSFEVKDVPTTVGTFCYNRCWSCDQKDVTFLVDMSKETVEPTGVSLAGSFQKAAGYPADWTPGVIFMKAVGTSKLYTTTLGIPAGNYEYKFVNGNTWGKDESVKGACAVVGGGNRTLGVGTVDMKLDTVCYRYCVTCKVASFTNDVAFDNAMNVYPNPAQNIVNLDYKFAQSTDLNIRVVNALGQTVLTASLPKADAGTAILDTHNFTDGMYMIQITDQNNHQAVKRLMIQK